MAISEVSCLVACSYACKLGIWVFVIIGVLFVIWQRKFSFVIWQWVPIYMTATGKPKFNLNLRIGRRNSDSFLVKLVALVLVPAYIHNFIFLGPAILITKFKNSLNVAVANIIFSLSYYKLRSDTRTTRQPSFWVVFRAFRVNLGNPIQSKFDLPWPNIWNIGHLERLHKNGTCDLVKTW